MNYGWLQCCAIFYCTEKWFRYVCAHTYSLSSSFRSLSQDHLKIVPVLYIAEQLLFKAINNIVRDDLYPKFFLNLLATYFQSGGNVSTSLFIIEVKVPVEVALCWPGLLQRNMTPVLCSIPAPGYPAELPSWRGGGEQGKSKGTERLGTLVGWSWLGFTGA